MKKFCVITNSHKDVNSEISKDILAYIKSKGGY